MNFDESPEFKKDIKALKKRVPTLKSDLDRVRTRIESLYVLGDDMTEADLGEFRAQFFSGKVAAVLSKSMDGIEVVKIRLDSDTDQYRNKLRLVFTAVKRKDSVLFVELFSKNDNDREDPRRFKKYL